MHRDQALCSQANELVDRALRLQDAGRIEDADALLAEAGSLLDEADAHLDTVGVPRIP